MSDLFGSANLILLTLYGPCPDKTCWVSHQVMLKPVSSATETSYVENLLEESLDMVCSKKQITKALISLRGCAGWSAPFLFANSEDRFSHVEAHHSSG